MDRRFCILICRRRFAGGTGPAILVFRRPLERLALLCHLFLGLFFVFVLFCFSFRSWVLFDFLLICFWSSGAKVCDRTRSGDASGEVSIGENSRRSASCGRIWTGTKRKTRWGTLLTAIWLILVCLFCIWVHFYFSNIWFTVYLR